MSPFREGSVALLFLAAAPSAPAFQLGPPPQAAPGKPEYASEAAFQPKAVAVIPPVVTLSRAAVRNAYNTHFLAAMPAVGFTGSIATCTPGTVSTAYKEWVIGKINYYRAMTGLPGIGLDTDATRESQQQAAALMYSANGMISHSIANPPFTVCSSLIATANVAASSSNIHYGTNDPVPLYMADTGITSVGHRRWFLFPPQLALTVGAAPGGPGVAAGAIKVFSLPTTTRPSMPNGVAWPNGGYVPTQVLPSGKYWSWSYPGAYFSAATVTMTANGTPISVTIRSTAENGYGDNTIVFEPAPTIAKNTDYRITIANIAGSGVPTSVTYTVRPFDPADPLPVATDLDGSGRGDLVWQNADGRTAVWLMNGLVPSSTAEVLAAGTGFSVAHIVDFDGNGKADLFWQHADGRAAIWLMNGSTPAGTTQVLNAGSGWSAVHVPDLNGDGKADIVWQHADGSTAAWLMNGATMTGGNSIMGSGTGWSVAKAGDFDGDGKGDLLWTHTDGRAAIWLMNGTVPSGTGQILNAGSGWSPAHVADLDGDGRSDIVWRHTDGSVAVWLMNGATMASGAGILGAGTGWSVERVADFDSDGRSDLFWQHTDGRAAIWLMNGVSPSSTAQILNAGSGWSLRRTADLDGDGKADIVWQHADGSVAAWLMNGTAMSSGSGILGPASGWSVSAASQ